MRKAPAPITPEKAMQRLEALCAKAEHCESELRTKLAGWKIAPPEAERIVADLRRRRFVDDSRFALAFVRDKFTFARWGRRKIEMSLRQKRIAPELIAAALETIDPDEYLSTAADFVARKRAAATDADTYEGRTKIFRAACARGFEPALIAQILRS